MGQPVEEEQRPADDDVAEALAGMGWQEGYPACSAAEAEEV